MASWDLKRGACASGFASTEDHGSCFLDPTGPLPMPRLSKCEMVMPIDCRSLPSFENTSSRVLSLFSLSLL